MNSPLTPSLALLLLIACSAEKTSTSETTDSTSLTTTSEQYAADTATYEEADYTEDSSDDYVLTTDDTLQSNLQTAIAETSAQANSVYSLNSDFDGYENGSDITYNFDEDFNLVYCEGRWDMEGTSGDYTYYFSDGNLLAGEESNDYDGTTEKVYFHSKFAPVYGLSIRDGGDQDEDSGRSTLGEADIDSRDRDIKSAIEQCVQALRENPDSATVDGEYVFVRIRTTANYGVDFPISNMFRVSKKLYENLTKE